MAESTFKQLENSLRERGVSGLLDDLIQQLDAQHKYHELFEALKMRLRHRLGLPLNYDDSGSDVDESTRRQLEEGLLDACREIGMKLIRQGKIREGWVYYRPVGENESVRAELDRVEASADKIDELIEVLLYEGVDPARGFSLVLQHYGTCNSITTLESQIHAMPAAAQQAAASKLVRHVHAELLQNVSAHLQQQGVETASGQTLGQLVAEHRWLTEGGNYHIDTSHLASTVRFGRILEDRETLGLALDLCRYGQSLDEPLRYPGEYPFEDNYTAHEHFYQCLLEDSPEVAWEYFQQRAEEANVHEQGSAAVETYVQLLARRKEYTAAVEASVRLLPPGTRTMGIAPSLFELSRRSGDFTALLDVAKQQDDLLGFATGLVTAATKNESDTF